MSTSSAGTPTSWCSATSSPASDPRAAERWNTAGAVLSRARTARDFAMAERVAQEGIDLLAGDEH